MKKRFLARVIERLAGPPPEDLEDTAKRLAITRAMVQELAGKDAATIALMELDAMVRARNDRR